MLRSSSKENPLLGLNLQRLLAAGRGAQGGSGIAAFAIATHPALRLGDGEPIYDGYLDVAGVGTLPDSCSAAALPRDVPFVSVLTGGDLSSASAMRGHGDAQSEGLRVYAVAGTAGAGLMAAGAPVVADIATAGVNIAADAGCREPIMNLILSHALDAVWQQLDDLLVRRQPLENLQQAESDATASFRGWRAPQVDLPLAGKASARQTCDAVTGSMQRFDVATLKQLYRDRNEYLRRFNAAVDQAVMKRLLVREDADALKAAAVRTTPVF